MKILNDLCFNPFEWLPRWQRLSPATRLLFIKEIGSNLKCPPPLFSDAHLHELTEAGFRKPGTPTLKHEVRPFRNLIRSMYRHQHFNDSATRLSREYVTDHLAAHECTTLPQIATEGRFHYNARAADAAQAAVNTSWLKSFTKLTSYDDWHISSYYNLPQLIDQESGMLLKAWIQRLIEGPNPIPFESLLEDAGNNLPLAFDALRAGIHHLLIFPALQDETLDPVIGIWPAIHQRLNLEKSTEPAPCTPPDNCSIHSTPFLLQDITILLVAAAGEGLVLKATGELYQKETNQLVARLSRQPPLTPDSPPVPPDSRIHDTRHWLNSLKLTTTKGKSGKNYRLITTSKGRDFLATPETEQLRILIDHLRQAHKRFAKGKMSYGDAITCIPGAHPNYNEKEKNIETCVFEAFSAYPTATWLSFTDFMVWHAKIVNPLLTNHALRNRQFYHRHHSSDEFTETYWQTMLERFLFTRLLPLGAAKLAIDAENTIWFSITPAGAYLMGSTETFDYQTTATEGDILIQSNFDIIFTAANAHAESELISFSERTGTGVGTLFRITRQSILNALDAGIQDTRIIETLQSLSSKKPPANIITQIRDWSKAFRQVSIKNIKVIQCPDPQTAMHICALFPNSTTQLNDTLLQLSGTTKTLNTIKKKLRKNGIGIH